jgi:hypothetical protein
MAGPATHLLPAAQPDIRVAPFVFFPNHSTESTDFKRGTTKPPCHELQSGSNVAMPMPTSGTSEIGCIEGCFGQSEPVLVRNDNLCQANRSHVMSSDGVCLVSAL